jgi:hypothetical protein
LAELSRKYETQANMIVSPTAQWAAHQIVEAFPWDTAPDYLFRDRGKIFGNVFQICVKSMGIEEVMTA